MGYLKQIDNDVYERKRCAQKPHNLCHRCRCAYCKMYFGGEFPEDKKHA